MTNSIHWATALQIALQAGWSDQEITDNLHELVAVLDQLALELKPEVFSSFMFGGNAYLEGARPIDVLRLTGKPEMLAEAISALSVASAA